MGRIWESINASNQHMLTHVPNGQIASSPLCQQQLFTASGACQLHPLYNVKVFSCLSYIPYWY